MLVLIPSTPRLGYDLAHDAGAGMRQPFLETISQALFDRDVATLRHDFAYMEAQRNRPDPPAVAAARMREGSRLAGG